MFRSDGSRFLTGMERLLMQLVYSIRKRLFVSVRLSDRGKAATYVCETPLDALRPLSLWVKEQGTMEWIDAEVQKGDVFMDIGANIGIYSLAAALRMGSTGRVYAFEPHKVNCLSLMKNVQVNGLQERIKVFSCALSNREGMVEFNYAELASASTSSQLGHRRIPGADNEFSPIAMEMVYSARVDQLLNRGEIVPPTLIKIDVDGNELLILEGMKQLLSGEQRPRSVQVELNVGEHDSISAFMTACGYELAIRHFTHVGKEARQRGVALADIAHNAIFRPLAA